MKIMLFLILVSLLLAAGFLLAYLRAARDGQFDDDYTPAIRMLFDSPPQPSGWGGESPEHGLSASEQENDFAFQATAEQQQDDLTPSL